MVTTVCDHVVTIVCVMVLCHGTGVCDVASTMLVVCLSSAIHL